MEAEVFGLFLKEIRKKRKMTIRQLELYSGVSNAYLSQLETGKRGIPSPDIIKKLSKGLNYSYEELMNKAGYWNKPIGEDWEWLTLIIGILSDKASGIYRKLLMALFDMIEAYSRADSFQKEWLDDVKQESENLGLTINEEYFIAKPFEATKHFLLTILESPDDLFPNLKNEHQVLTEREQREEMILEEFSKLPIEAQDKLLELARMMALGNKEDKEKT